MVDAWRGQAASEEPDGVSTAETPPTGRPKTESDAEELTVITSGATTNGESPPPVGDGPIKPK